MRIIAIDEVGVGCLAGPVVICAVVADDDFPAVKDSKQYSPAQREHLYQTVSDAAIDSVVLSADSKAIDNDGLWDTWDNLVTMAVQQLRYKHGDLPVILDGNRIPRGLTNVRAMPKADERVPAVGGASIIAKVVRDEIMHDLSFSYPGYDLEKNAGYGSAKHREAIKELGPTPIHRLTFLTKILASREDSPQETE